MYIADFYCHELKLVVEVDGSIHNIEEVIEYDIVREEDISSFGIRVVRFRNSEIRNQIESVIDRIRNIITELRTNGTNKEKSN